MTNVTEQLACPSNTFLLSRDFIVYDNIGCGILSYQPELASKVCSGIQGRVGYLIDWPLVLSGDSGSWCEHRR